MINKSSIWVKIILPVCVILFVIFFPCILLFHYTNDISMWGGIYALFRIFTDPKTSFFASASAFCCLLFMWLWYQTTGKKRIFYYALSVFFALQVTFGSFMYSFAMNPFREAPVAFKYHVIFGIFWFMGIFWLLCVEFFSRKQQIIYGVILAIAGVLSLAGSIVYFVQSTPLFTPHGALKGVIIKLGLASLFLLISGCLMIKLPKK